MTQFTVYIAALYLVLQSTLGHAQDKIELDTTRIKGNTELPKYMYVVPWQDKELKNTEEQKLVLHNLYSDLFDPVLPDYISPSELPARTTPDK